MTGFEPVTPELSALCSTRLSYTPAYGAGGRTRTDKPKRDILSVLSLPFLHARDGFAVAHYPEPLPLDAGQHRE